LSNRFAALSDLPSDDSCALCEVITKTIRDAACAVAPAQKHVHKPWLSAQAIALLEKKRIAMLQGDTVERSNLQRAF
jgi:hypothetical protein